MNKLKVQRWTRTLGIVVSVLFITALALSYPFVRAFVVRLKDASKAPQKHLSLLDKVDLFLEYELNKRIRGLGVGLYRLTGGRITGFAQAKVLLLTTRGRRSGKARTVLLQFFHDGANLVVVAANSGRSDHPDWFFNLKATPTAQVQIMDRTLLVRAEELSTEEANAFWPYILRVAPTNRRYQLATGRIIPLVHLVPTEITAERTRTREKALAAKEKNYE